MPTRNIYFSEESDQLLISLAAQLNISHSAIVAMGLRELDRRERLARAREQKNTSRRG